MNFELTDEQAMLRQAVSALLSGYAPIGVVRDQLDRDDDVDPELWRLAADLGWPGLVLPEEYGGSGQGLVDLTLVTEEAGRALARGPFSCTATVGHALAECGSPGIRAEILPALASGSDWATWAFAEHNAPWTPDGLRATARDGGDVITLDGIKIAVQNAAGARWLLVTARYAGIPTSFLVDRDTPGLTIRRERTLDPTRLFYEVRLDAVRVPADRRLDGGPGAVQRLLDYAAVLRCADAVGAMQRMLELTVDYTKVREQFGHPIGSFQAVKHACADAALRVHGARAATYYAAMAADAGTADADRAACVAASYVSDVAGSVADAALQLHGGIGFTWEHDLHLYLRRAKTDRVLYGDASVHRERLFTLLRKSL
ncbi:acyl-CoA dehydrogenase family protein [Nocardia alni]|uniref:acyl-CoA dehydrogenase family protein n=1 Tax=Nocardia alni TaxID=2815723 RepID=UPI001C224C96|nr:acyl-CoA dehydrogenase family protein [Nocardia alni]